MNETLFRNSFDILGFERAIRMKRVESNLTFGIPFLDDALGGIATNDLIVIGARPGAGKTEIVNTIALHNIFRNKRVHFYALEAEKYEVERRAKYKLISFLIGEHEPELLPTLNYMDWYNGLTSAVTDKYEEMINQKYGHFFKNLNSFYRESEFRIDEFESSLQHIKDNTDLIIIDHLHYFDFDDGNEAMAIKSTVKKIRDLALLVSKPVILVSHLRRPMTKSPILIPGTDEFHGSSEILKISTKAVTLAPALDQKDDNGRWLTYMRVVKCRFDGSRTRYVGLCCFNPRANKYEKNYVIGTLNSQENKFQNLEFFRTPKWAQNIAIAKEDAND